MSEDQNTSHEDVVAAAQSDGAYTLLVADFADTSTAWDAYEMLRSVEDGKTVAIEGVVVVKREADGKLEVQKATDHSTRSGLKWGVVGGLVVGVLFPPSLLGSAAVVGAAGAATGKIRQVHHRSELADELEDSIAPGIRGSSPSCRTRRRSRSKRPWTRQSASLRPRSTTPRPQRSKQQPNGMRRRPSAE